MISRECDLPCGCRLDWNRSGLGYFVVDISSDVVPSFEGMVRFIECEKPVEVCFHYCLDGGEVLLRSGEIDV